MKPLKIFQKKPILSVVVVFHNMRREAKRTLFTLCSGYQEGVLGSEYEVIAVDSNSQDPLDKKMVLSFGTQFRYYQVVSKHPSPCRAMNEGVDKSQGDYVMCLIDGARMLSPGIIRKSLQALKEFDNPFIYTLGMHLGSKVQNESILDGYNQSVEDEMLNHTPWINNGYRLFSISSVALSSKDGFYSELTESNCFSLHKESYFLLGGLDEEFITPGGGLVNLDFFKRATLRDEMTPVMLLGEATFHQYHGGVATNVPMKDHPWPDFAAEYLRIRGKGYEPHFRRPVYFGEIVEEASHLVLPGKS